MPIGSGSASASGRSKSKSLIVLYDRLLRFTRFLENFVILIYLTPQLALVIKSSGNLIKYSLDRTKISRRHKII